MPVKIGSHNLQNDLSELNAEKFQPSSDLNPWQVATCSLASATGATHTNWHRILIRIHCTLTADFKALHRILQVLDLS